MRAAAASHRIACTPHAPPALARLLYLLSLTPPRRTVPHRYDYHTNGHKDAVFALSVACFAHYGAVASCWVYIGVLNPHARAKKKKDKED